MQHIDRPHAKLRSLGTPKVALHDRGRYILIIKEMWEKDLRAEWEATLEAEEEEQNEEAEETVKGKKKINKKVEKAKQLAADKEAKQLQLALEAKWKKELSTKAEDVINLLIKISPDIGTIGEILGGSYSQFLQLCEEYRVQKDAAVALAAEQNKPSSAALHVAREILTYTSTTKKTVAIKKDKTEMKMVIAYPDFAEMDEQDMGQTIERHILDKQGQDKLNLFKSLNPETDTFNKQIDLILESDIGTLTAMLWEDYKNQPGLGKSAGWATKSIKNAAAAHANSQSFINKFGTNEHTLHHKVSQAQLKLLSKAIDCAGQEALPLKMVLDQIGQDINGVTKYERILLNMPANLEVGVRAERQTNGRGSAFDGNINVVQRSRSNSIRSGGLIQVDSMISNASMTSTVKKLPKGEFPEDFNWAKIAGYIQNAHAEHMKLIKGTGNILTAPQLAQWETDGMKENVQHYKRNNH